MEEFHTVLGKHIPLVPGWKVGDAMPYYAKDDFEDKAVVQLRAAVEAEGWTLDELLEACKVEFPGIFEKAQK